MAATPASSYSWGHDRALPVQTGRVCKTRFVKSGYGRPHADGFRVSGFGFRVSGFGFLVSGFWFRVSGLRFQVSGFRFPVSEFGRRHDLIVHRAVASQRVAEAAHALLDLLHLGLDLVRCKSHLFAQGGHLMYPL